VELIVAVMPASTFTDDPLRVSVEAVTT